MALITLFLEVFKNATIWDMLLDLMLLTVPLWIAVFVGVVVGWAWRPKWALFAEESSSSTTSSSSASDKGFNSILSLTSFKSLFPSFLTRTMSDSLEDSNCNNPSLVKHERSVPSVVNEADLRILYQLVEMQDGGPAWIHMMDRSTPKMTYQAWRRDPPTGPPQYRSRTVFEDATPEMVRDFFWDDAFRCKWDDMLIHHAILEENQTTGAMIVQWVRKFPFFCSDREYVIGRRIWESEGSYYCVTKVMLLS
ncbi:StAR-related lipid transfer protein 7 mitochondrial [Bienertia sinuspersici]